MDAALRRLQRDGDLAREALIEARAGGGILGWLDSSDAGELGAHVSERKLVGMLLGVVAPDPEDGDDDRMHWARGLGAARPVVIVRLSAGLVVISFYQGGFPNESVAEWGAWVENQANISSDLSDTYYGSYDIRACCPKRSVKDRLARNAYDAMVERVRAWSVNLQKLQAVPAMAFTLEQTRVYRGLDPYGR